MRIYIAAALMLSLYLLPWVVNPSASLTPNGYDLAEWASVHPAVQVQTPMLLTSLLLRLPLACLALLVAFGARRGVLPALIVLIAAAELLPPPEFILATGDPNYRQKAALALLTLVGGALGWGEILPRYRRWIAAGIALVGALASVLGLAQGYSLMRSLELPTQIGAGAVGMAAAFGIVAFAFSLDEIRRATLNGTPRLTTAANQTG